MLWGVHVLEYLFLALCIQISVDPVKDLFEQVIVFERDARNSDFEAKRAKDAAWTTKQLAECLMEVQRKANR